MLHAGKPATLDDAWWRARLDATLARREGIADAQTNGLRLINGESDGWPGLVLDRYDTTLVLKLYTAAWLPRRGLRTHGQPSRPIEWPLGGSAPPRASVVGTGKLW